MEVGRYENEYQAEHNDVHHVNDGEGKQVAVLLHLRLSLDERGHGEDDVERPGKTDEEDKRPRELLRFPKELSEEVEPDEEDGVELEEIRVDIDKKVALGPLDPSPRRRGGETRHLTAE